MSEAICKNAKPFLEPIPKKLEDRSLALYPNHNVYTHLGCVAIRTGLGLALINPNITKGNRKVIIYIIIIALIIFGIKYLRTVVNNITLWKSYLRMLVSYSAALYLTTIHQDSSAGLLIIADALIAMQGRHTTSVVSCGLQT